MRRLRRARGETERKHEDMGIVDEVAALREQTLARIAHLLDFYCQISIVITTSNFRQTEK